MSKEDLINKCNELKEIAGHTNYLQSNSKP